MSQLSICVVKWTVFRLFLVAILLEQLLGWKEMYKAIYLL